MAGISINLAGNFSKLDELKNKAQSTAGSIKSAFNSKLGKQMFAGIAVAGAAAFAGIVASVKMAIDAGGELSDMMAKTGASGENLMILKKAFENAGLSANEVGTSLARMQKALSGVNEDGASTGHVFAKLGLSVEELMGMDPAEALMKIGNSISAIQDPAKRTAVAMELFGRSGANLNVVFTDAAAFETAKTQLGGLAALLPGMAADADVVSDAFGSIDDKTKQLGAGIAKELMPQLLQVAEWINQTDFTTIGRGIGILVKETAELGSALQDVMKFSPAYQLGKLAGGALVNFGNLTDEEKAQTIAEAQEAADKLYEESRANPKPVTTSAAEVFNPFEADREKMRKDREKKAAKEAVSAAKAAEAKAAADAKAAVETQKNRDAAAEEYRLEKAMLAARLRGDADRLAKLEREKSIREEMKRLESAGFTAKEARKPAEAKVDAEKKAIDAETRRQAAVDEKQRVQEILAGKVNSARENLDSHSFQSSLGAVSSMQRIGGGGGATGSGLDYARQQSDLLRELNAGMRQLVEASRKEVEI